MIDRGTAGDSRWLCPLKARLALYSASESLLARDACYDRGIPFFGICISAWRGPLNPKSSECHSWFAIRVCFAPAVGTLPLGLVIGLCSSILLKIGFGARSIFHRQKLVYLCRTMRHDSTLSLSIEHKSYSYVGYGLQKECTL